VLLGQIALAEKQPQTAANHFDKAMQPESELLLPRTWAPA
jgi:hypothetical protein